MCRWQAHKFLRKGRGGGELLWGGCDPVFFIDKISFLFFFQFFSLSFLTFCSLIFFFFFFSCLTFDSFVTSLFSNQSALSFFLSVFPFLIFLFCIICFRASLFALSVVSEIFLKFVLQEAFFWRARTKLF